MLSARPPASQAGAEAAYQFVSELGEGQFGSVQLMRHAASGQLRAVKLIRRGEGVGAEVEREVLHHHRLCPHAHVIGLQEVFLTPGHLCLALEYAPAGTLFDLVQRCGRLAEPQAAPLFGQLVAALAWCHSQGIAHRDVKLENALLAPAAASCGGGGSSSSSSSPRSPRSGTLLLKLSDFGLSAPLAPQPGSAAEAGGAGGDSVFGTPAYVAPEALAGGQYDYAAADVWSCGVVLYCMLVGRYPFQDPARPDNLASMLQRIAAARFSFPPDCQLTPECTSLVGAMLVRDPRQRISLAAVLQHPWLAQAGLPLPHCRRPAGARPLQSEQEVRALLSTARLHVGSQEFDRKDRPARSDSDATLAALAT